MAEQTVFLVSDYAESPAPRSAAWSAADQAATALSRKTGFDYRVRWNADDSSWMIEQKPFSPPEKSWNNEDNCPDRRSPDWKEKPSIVTNFDRLILDAGKLQMLQWLICDDTPRDGRPIKDITRDLQAGLDAQYGRGHFWAHNHGHRVSVQCRYPWNSDVG